MRGEIARFDIVTKQGKLIVQKDKRITVKHVRDWSRRVGAKIAVIGRVPARPHPRPHLVTRKPARLSPNATTKLPRVC